MDNANTKNPSAQVDEQVSKLLSGLDMSSILSSLPDFSDLAMKLAPQELDKLVDILIMAASEGLGEILSTPVQDGTGQANIMQRAISRELAAASPDFGVADLSQKINIADLVGLILTHVQGANQII